MTEDQMALSELATQFGFEHLTLGFTYGLPGFQPINLAAKHLC